MNEQVFGSLCLPLGRAVFTQEGQFGEGLAHHIRDSGRVGLVAINLFKYFHDPPGPVDLMYDLDGTPVLVVGRDAEGTAGDKEVKVNWHFFDDGELATTGGANPYFGKAFRYDASYTAAWVEKLEEKEAAGWRIATVADYVDHIEAYGYEPGSLPPVPDGAWQPADTVNVQRWMGLAGNFSSDENDNGVLGAVTRSRFMLQAAEQAFVFIHIDEQHDPSGRSDEEYRAECRAKLEEGWRHQMLAEVSDSTGWNPWKGEVEYSLEHAAEAAKLGEQVALEPFFGVPGPNLPPPIDTAPVELEWSFPAPVHYGVDFVALPACFELLAECEPADAPVDVTVAAAGWDTALSWCELASGGHLLKVDFEPGSEASRTVQVSFPRFSDTVSYVPALMELEGKVVDIDLPSVVGQEGAPDLALALANGLVGLGDGRWLVTVNAFNHVAAFFPGDEESVVFLDETTSTGAPVLWSFFYFDGLTAKEAIHFANRVNVYPVLEFNTDSSI